MKAVLILGLTVSLSFILILPAAPMSAADLPHVTSLDIVTEQDGSLRHPDQVAIERTLQSGRTQPERFRMTPVPASREYGMAVLVRILDPNGRQATGDGGAIAHQDQIDGWAKSQVFEGQQLGLYGDTFGASTFEPRANATRADVSQVLDRALNTKK